MYVYSAGPTVLGALSKIWLTYLPCVILFLRGAPCALLGPKQLLNYFMPWDGPGYLCLYLCICLCVYINVSFCIVIFTHYFWSFQKSWIFDILLPYVATCRQSCMQMKKITTIIVRLWQIIDIIWFLPFMFTLLFQNVFRFFSHRSSWPSIRIKISQRHPQHSYAGMEQRLWRWIRAEIPCQVDPLSSLRL